MAARGPVVIKKLGRSRESSSIVSRDHGYRGFDFLGLEIFASRWNGAACRLLLPALRGRGGAVAAAAHVPRR